MHLEEITLDLNNDDTNIVLTTAVDKARVLNHYFCSIFTSENTSTLSRLRDRFIGSWGKEKCQSPRERFMMGSVGSILPKPVDRMKYLGDC